MTKVRSEGIFVIVDDGDVCLGEAVLGTDGVREPIGPFLKVLIAEAMFVCLLPNIEKLDECNRQLTTPIEALQKS